MVSEVFKVIQFDMKHPVGVPGLISFMAYLQCWTKGRSSTAVAEDFRPTATATVAEVLGHSYGRRKNLNFL